jgi:NADH:ubiquinone oxidoreductase subunit 6 (subunit J)
MERDEVEAAAKLTLMIVTISALFLVIGTGNWGPDAGYAPSERSVAPYTEFAKDLFVQHGFELVLAALIIAAATLGGLQIAREEEYD